MIDSLVSDTCDVIVENLKKEKNIRKIKEKIIKPLVDYIACEMRPYIIATCLFVVTTISMLIVIVAILSKPR